LIQLWLFFDSETAAVEAENALKEKPIRQRCRIARHVADACFANWKRVTATAGMANAIQDQCVGEIG
jgi:hypothetical protein